MKQLVFLSLAFVVFRSGFAYVKADSSNNKLLYNSFQYSDQYAKFLTGNLQRIWEVRTGLYFRNGPLISGINVGYMHMKSLGDTVQTTHSQIPVYWSTAVFLRDKIRLSAPYIKLDLGFIAAESVYASRINSTVKTRIAPLNINTAIINIGLGYKMAVYGSTAGVCIEAGYKYLPTLAPGKKKNDFPYFTLGFIF